MRWGACEDEATSAAVSINPIEIHKELQKAATAILQQPSQYKTSLQAATNNSAANVISPLDNWSPRKLLDVINRAKAKKKRAKAKKQTPVTW